MGPILKDNGWREALMRELEASYMQDLSTFLRGEIAARSRFFPPPSQILAAFDATPLDRVKVVILGQDPYHRAGQAMGLSFSVPPTVPLPPSLRNVFKELVSDLGCSWPRSGDLTPWAHEGVLLLNTSLTVAEGEAASHSAMGWQKFTDRVIEILNDQAQDGVVFLLWGRHAKEKGAIIDRERHHVLSAAHPSPFSASSGFFGCKHFSRANELLSSSGRSPVDWALPT